MQELFEIINSRKMMDFPTIPVESVNGWKNIPIKECGEKLVPVGAFSEFSACDTNAVYFGERGRGEKMNFLKKPVDRSVSLIAHFVREGVLEKIKLAQSLLPANYYFRFLDNYRSLAVQRALYDDQKEKLRKENPEWDEAKLEKETQIYVSLPSPNVDYGTVHPSPHSTGGVVDVTLIRMSKEGRSKLEQLEFKKSSNELAYPIGEDERNEFQIVESWIDNESHEKKWNKAYGKYVENHWLIEYRYAREKADIFRKFAASVNMGTGFDHFGSEAATRYFEELIKQRKLSKSEKEALQNRRFLFWVMKKAGFSNYPEEWWHWSYGDNMDAANCGKKFAIYGGIKMSEENLAFEWAKRGPYFDSMKRIGRKGLFMNLIEDDPSAISM
jgi:D-alanyl-D-alanine dipeptidase